MHQTLFSPGGWSKEVDEAASGKNDVWQGKRVELIARDVDSVCAEGADHSGKKDWHKLQPQEWNPWARGWTPTLRPRSEIEDEQKRTDAEAMDRVVMHLHPPPKYTHEEKKAVNLKPPSEEQKARSQKHKSDWDYVVKATGCNIPMPPEPPQNVSSSSSGFRFATSEAKEETTWAAKAGAEQRFAQQTDYPKKAADWKAAGGKRRWPESKDKGSKMEWKPKG